MREKCPNTEFFLVRIFLHSDWIWRVFRPNVGKYGPEKTPYLDTFHAVKDDSVLNELKLKRSPKRYQLLLS